MAAGEGRRLRPLTERWPKAVLPVDGRAVIATLVRQLKDEGIGPVTVVTGHLAEQVEKLLEPFDGRFVRQPEVLGSADAVSRALAAGAGLPAIVIAVEPVLREGDLERFRLAFAESDAAGAVAFSRQAGSPSIRMEDGLVRRVVHSAPGDLRPEAIWGLTEQIDLTVLGGPPFELADAFQRAIDAGKPVAGIEVVPTRYLTDPFDLMRENFPYLE